MQENKSLKAYAKLCKEIDELTQLKENLRQLIELQYSAGIVTDEVTVFYQNTSKYKYSKELEDLKKSNKESITRAEELEQNSGVAVKTLVKILKITVK